jgi:hypothetical protein
VPTGAWQLGDGNYLISTGIGIFKYDVTGNSFAQVLGGVSGQYINPFIPEPSCLSVLAAAGLLALANRLPADQRWYNSAWWHVSVLLAAVVIAVLMTRQEAKDGVYSLLAIFSPTKLYHNVLLYAGYGYVIVTTLVAVLFGADWSWSFAGWLGLALLPGLVWVYLVVKDNSLGSEESKRKADTAHVFNWRPLWRNKWHVRRLKTVRGRKVFI